MEQNSLAVNAGPDGAGNDGGIALDAGSGISLEEQREILAGIDHLAEKNRRELGAGGAEPFAAKKRGILFPLLVNGAAILILAGAFLFLLSMRGKEEERFREGRVVYSSAERALIEEIRRETTRKLGEKEQEIDLVVSRLDEVDAELQSLQVSVDTQAEERKLTLRRLHDEYESTLAGLQDERSEILESSRTREAALKAQFEARAGELAAAAAESEARLGAARSELERLAGEQERAAAIDAQLSGFFVRAGGAIRAGSPDAAAGILKSARDFLNTPVFQGMRSFQSRKELYTAAADALEGMLGELKKNTAAVPAAVEETAGADSGAAALNAELAGKNAALEREITELKETITALSGEGSDLGQMLAEARETAATLRNLNQALEAANAERVTAISALQSQNGTLTQTVTERDRVIAELRAQTAAQVETIENLNTQLASIRQALQTLSQ
jgi:chromosome segregation ATPase